MLAMLVVCPWHLTLRGTDSDEARTARGSTAGTMELMLVMLAAAAQRSVESTAEARAATGSTAGTLELMLMCGLPWHGRLSGIDSDDQTATGDTAGTEKLRRPRFLL